MKIKYGRRIKTIGYVCLVILGLFLILGLALLVEGDLRDLIWFCPLAAVAYLLLFLGVDSIDDK